MPRGEGILEVVVVTSVCQGRSMVLCLSTKRKIITRGHQQIQLTQYIYQHFKQNM